MSSFKVIGGTELHGSITPQGSKNEALQIVASSILVQNLLIKNIPNILDVRNLVLILEEAGAKVSWTLNSVHIDTRNIGESYFESAEYFARAEKLRGSLMLMGPLLARYGKCCIPKTGGDKIGRRPIDTHVLGFIKCGAVMSEENGIGKLTLNKDKVISGEILLEEASVTGTANILMCAARSAKDLVIYNAASETYISQLCEVLSSTGLSVTGSGSNRLTLNRSASINNFNEMKEHSVFPDFIEVASFIALSVATKSEITIKSAGVKNLGQTLSMFEKLGCKFDIVGDDIKVLKQEKYEIKKMYDGGMISIYSAPWPMMSPDILSLGIVASMQCEGVALFHEKMYEARMFFVDKLIAMGAKIVLCDPHRVVVTGNNWKSHLSARHMTSPDIRAGISLLIAALGAEGESVIDNIEQIDRGYENIEKRLALLGAQITRID